MNPEIIIYRQTYKHRGREFTVWSYLDDPNPERSGMRFAFEVEGVTVRGIPDRAEAVRKARQRIDGLPAKPVEKTSEADPPQVRQEHPQQVELALG